MIEFYWELLGLEKGLIFFSMFFGDGFLMMWNVMLNSSDCLMCDYFVIESVDLVE